MRITCTSKKRQEADVRTPTEVAAQIWCRPELAKTQMDAVLGTAIAEEIQEARIEGARLALKAAAKKAEDQIKLYPLSVWPEPPDGEHGKTVDACSARAMRKAFEIMATLIRTDLDPALVVESQKGKG
jgi:hypothetical protein